MNYAPVILFTYNRPYHTRQVLQALARNTLAPKTDLFIFSDAAKNEKSAEKVNQVRALIEESWVADSFQSVSIHKEEINKGLAASIISGVGKVIDETGAVIVIEDDSYPAKNFLEFMNDCLDYYKDDREIWSVGGYSPITDFPADYVHDVYIMGRTCSYAWATWKNRWELVDWEVSDYKKFKFSIYKRWKFNRYGNDRSGMLDSQQKGLINSWAIRFCYSMFKHGMFTVYPRITKIKNIGEDGSGTNFTVAIKRSTVDLIEDGCDYKMEKVKLDQRIVSEFTSKFNQPFSFRIIQYIKKNILY